jgi:hypothetical protein
MDENLNSDTPGLTDEQISAKASTKNKSKDNCELLSDTNILLRLVDSQSSHHASQNRR